MRSSLSAIAGIADLRKGLYADRGYNRLLAADMADAMRRPGDTSEEWVGEHAVLACTHSAGERDCRQLFKAVVGGYEFAICFSGCLYRTRELRAGLVRLGCTPELGSDAELVLLSYLQHGEKCAERLEGAFSFCIWDSMRRLVLACRDPSGFEPFFYAFADGMLVFASEAAALFRHPILKPRLTKTGAGAIFGAAAELQEDSAVFDGIYSLPASSLLLLKKSGAEIKKYSCDRASEALPPRAAAEELKTAVTEAIEQTLPKEPPSALLFGDLGSYITAALLKKYGRISTLSAELKGGAPCAAERVQSLSTIYGAELLKADHTIIFYTAHDLSQGLMAAVRLCGLPDPSGVSAVLHCILSSASRCCDTLFSGLTPNALPGRPEAACFPPELWRSVLFDEVFRTLEIGRAADTDPSCAGLPEESVVTYSPVGTAASQYGAAAAGALGRVNSITLRLPLCGSRTISTLAEYAPNYDERELLLDAFSELLPPGLPLTSGARIFPADNAALCETLKGLLLEEIADGTAPLLTFADSGKIRTLARKSTAHSAKFLAYLVQVNYWLKEFNPILI